MRFSTVFISSAIVLAGMSTALPIEKDDTLVARFADSDLEVEARGFDEESELYARGGAISRLRGNKLPSYRDASSDPPPRYTRGDEQMAPPHVRQAWSGNRHRPTNYENNRKSPSYASGSNHRSHGRRSYYDDELVARGSGPSKIGGGDKERKDDKPPKYKVVKKDPVPPYEGSPDHIPFLDSFQTETDYSNNRKSATKHGSHGAHGSHGSASAHGSHGAHGPAHGSHGPHHRRRSFYDLD